jgi:hypothetical protein
MARQKEMKKDLEHLFASTLDGKARIPFVVDPVQATHFLREDPHTHMRACSMRVLDVYT